MRVVSFAQFIQRAVTAQVSHTRKKLDPRLSNMLREGCELRSSAPSTRPHFQLIPQFLHRCPPQYLLGGSYSDETGLGETAVLRMLVAISVIIQRIIVVIVAFPPFFKPVVNVLFIFFIIVVFLFLLGIVFLVVIFVLLRLLLRLRFGVTSIMRLLRLVVIDVHGGFLVGRVRLLFLGAWCWIGLGRCAGSRHHGSIGVCAIRVRLPSLLLRGYFAAVCIAFCSLGIVKF